MSLYTPYSSKGASTSRLHVATSEFEILKDSHKFLREDDDVEESQLSWDDRLAKKYYSSLYREYAVCDLKHYKSGNFALRWRTEEEVLSGAGETTCGNARCPLHKDVPGDVDEIRPALTTLELPFSYAEHGESKFALVKVVLCPKCCKKLMWKRNKEKEQSIPEAARGHPTDDPKREKSDAADFRAAKRHTPLTKFPEERKRRGERTQEPAGDDSHKRRRSSRSLSPRHQKDHRHMRPS